MSSIPSLASDAVTDGRGDAVSNPRLSALLQRQSVARLSDPPPDAAQRELILAAGLRAPDHGRLRPWRFLSIVGAGRDALGELMLASARRLEPDAPERWERARNAPLRAPWLVVCVLSPAEHPKVPVQEQWLSAGCAAYGMLLAADALGYGGVWRTGDAARDRLLMQALGLADHEHIVGFLYIGTPASAPRHTVSPDLEAHVTQWPQAH